MKIGERDTIAQWHTKRCSMQSRAPGLYLLDERTRLAGCHMIRDAVERLVLEEGGDPFKQFMREAIEDGRRDFKSRVRGLLVPGRYRSAGFTEAKYANKQNLPKRAQRDLIIHGAYEAVVDQDGRWTTDLRGSSAWGWHSFNATPSAPAGDAVDPLHADADLQRQDQRRRLLRDRAAADRGQLGEPRRRALLVLVPLDADVHHLDRLPAGGLARPAVARLHRGDRLHLHGAGQRRPGRRHRPVRADLRLHELRDRRPGAGREVRPRRARLRRRRLQPRGRHGRRRDVGAGQADDLPRPPDQAQHRRHRPPPRRLLVRDAAARQRHPGLRDREHRRGRDAHLAGALRRLPGAERLRPQRLRLRHLRAGGGGQGLPGRRRQRRGVGDVGLRRTPPARTGPVHDDDRGQDRRPLPLLRARRRRPRRPAAAQRGADRGGHRRRPHPAPLGRARLRPREPRRPDARPPRARPPGVASGGPSSASASSTRT